jgi:hypothetical protein
MRPPITSPLELISELWLGVLRVFRGEGLCRSYEDILLGECDGSGVGPCFLLLKKRGRVGSRIGTQESVGFNKNVMKSGPLMIRDKGQS